MSDAPGMRQLDYCRSPGEMMSGMSLHEPVGEPMKTAMCPLALGEALRSIMRGPAPQARMVFAEPGQRTTLGNRKSTLPQHNARFHPNRHRAASSLL
jgi:hypothetical protein